MSTADDPPVWFLGWVSTHPSPGLTLGSAGRQSGPLTVDCLQFCVAGLRDPSATDDGREGTEEKGNSRPLATFLRRPLSYPVEETRVVVWSDSPNSSSEPEQTCSSSSSLVRSVPLQHRGSAGFPPDDAVLTRHSAGVSLPSPTRPRRQRARAGHTKQPWATNGPCRQAFAQRFSFGRCPRHHPSRRSCNPGHWTICAGTTGVKPAPRWPWSRGLGGHGRPWVRGPKQMDELRLPEPLFPRHHRLSFPFLMPPLPRVAVSMWSFNPDRPAQPSRSCICMLTSSSTRSSCASRGQEMQWRMIGP